MKGPTEAKSEPPGRSRQAVVKLTKNKYNDNVHSIKGSHFGGYIFYRSQPYIIIIFNVNITYLNYLNLRCTTKYNDNHHNKTSGKTDVYIYIYIYYIKYNSS